MTFPRIVVLLDAGDRPADQTALLVTKPVEQAIRRVPGVLNIRSGTSRGGAVISLDFGWGRDMIATTLQVNAAVAQAVPSLPDGTTYTVRLMDPTTFPIIAYGLTSDVYSQAQLRDLVYYQMLPMLSSIPGVARADLVGGAVAEVHVIVDPFRLQSHGLVLSDVATEIKNSNVLSAVGHIEDHDKLYLVVADNTLNQIDDVKNVILKSEDGNIVHVGDVAQVTSAAAPQFVKVVEDGKPAVLFQVYEQPDGNSVQIAREVRAKLASFKLPQGVRIANWYDQSELVINSAVSVRDAVAIGLVLAGLVLLAFLRSIRTTMVAVIVVPAVLIITILILKLLHFSFNIMTLGGIAAAVGLVIDDVIVMVEHIARRAGLRDGGGGAAAVLPAGREFMQPLTGSSLATIIVFVPLSFLGGVTGAFSKALSVTMGSALVISYLVTAFAVPVLARGIINYDKWHDPSAGHEGWVGRTHRALLRGLFRAPWLLVVLFIPLAGLGWIAYSHVGTGFIPKIDEGGFVLDYIAKPGTSLPETDRELQQVESILANTPDVLTFSRRTGLGLGGGDLNEPNQGDFFVRLKSGDRRPIEEVMDEVNDEVSRDVPGLDIDLAQLMEDLIGDLTAVPQPIEIKLNAVDPAKLIPQARKIADALGKVNGVVDVNNGVTLAGDGLNVRVDPVRAAVEGVGPDDVQAQLEGYLPGTIATKLANFRRETGRAGLDSAAAPRARFGRRDAANSCARRPHLPAQAGCHRYPRFGPARDHAREPAAHPRRDRAHRGPRSRLHHRRRSQDARSARNVGPGRLVHVRRSLCAAADRLPGPCHRLHRDAHRRIPPPSLPLRADLAALHHHRHLAAFDNGGFHGPVGDGRRAQHHRLDRHDDGDRHCHGNVDLLCLRARRALRDHAAASRAHRGESQPHAAHCDDDARGNSHAHAARACAGAGRGDAAAPCDRHHRGPDSPVSAGLVGDAGPDRLDLAARDRCMITRWACPKARHRGARHVHQG